MGLTVELLWTSECLLMQNLTKECWSDYSGQNGWGCTQITSNWSLLAFGTYFYSLDYQTWSMMSTRTFGNLSGLPNFSPASIFIHCFHSMWKRLSVVHPILHVKIVVQHRLDILKDDFYDLRGCMNFGFMFFRQTLWPFFLTLGT